MCSDFFKNTIWKLWKLYCRSLLTCHIRLCVFCLVLVRAVSGMTNNSPTLTGSLHDVPERSVDASAEIM